MFQPGERQREAAGSGLVADGKPSYLGEALSLTQFGPKWAGKTTRNGTDEQLYGIHSMTQVCSDGVMPRPFDCR